MPKEQFIWLKIIQDKEYTRKIINIKGADEYYVIFTSNSPEIRTSTYFKGYILNKVNLLKENKVF